MLLYEKANPQNSNPSADYIISGIAHSFSACYNRPDYFLGLGRLLGSFCIPNPAEDKRIDCPTINFLAESFKLVRRDAVILITFISFFALHVHKAIHTFHYIITVNYCEHAAFLSVFAIGALCFTLATFCA